MMFVRFSDHEKWAYTVEECREYLAPPWVHLDWFLARWDGGEEVAVLVSGSALVGNCSWWFTQEMGRCLTASAERLTTLRTHAETLVGSVSHALGQSGIRVLPGWVAGRGGPHG